MSYAPDHRDKLAGIGRQLHAIARDVTLDPEDLTDVFGRLAEELAQAQAAAVANLRQQGHSWQAIGAGLSMTRQAAQQRYAGQRPAIRDDRGQLADLGAYVPVNA